MCVCVCVFYGGPGGHFHHSSLHLCHSSLHLCHSTSTTPHSTSVTLLPAIPPPWLHPRHAPPPNIRRGVGGAISIARCSSPNSSVCDGSGSGSGKRGRLVSILEKCLLSGNEDKLMRVIESVVPSKCEHASFTPLVLSACGGLATGASTFYKRLASLLAEKWEQPYSITVKGATLPIMPSHLCIACIDLH